jgi:hypothetical protein
MRIVEEWPDVVEHVNDIEFVDLIDCTLPHHKVRVTQRRPQVRQRLV